MATEGLPATVTWRVVVNWAAVGAVIGALALIQTPIVLGVVAIWHWCRSVDKRLTEIETRSHQRRHGDASEKPL